MRTVDWYDATLNSQFLPWCADEGVTDPGDLTPQVVGRFTARLIERQGAHGPLSRSTVRTESPLARQSATKSWASEVRGRGGGRLGLCNPVSSALGRGSAVQQRLTL